MVLTAKRAAEICREWYVAFRNKGKGEEKCVLELIDAADTIEALEAAQPKWISVNERMPEDCIDVLVFTRSGYTSSISIAHALKGRWFSKGIPIETVTHWMQLPSMPEPPKEDA